MKEVVKTENLILNVSDLLLQGRGRIQVYSGNNWVAVPATVVAGTTTSSGTVGVVVKPGKRLYITNMTITSDGPGLVEALVGVDAAGNWYNYIGVANTSVLFGSLRFSATFGVNGGSTTIPVPDGYILYENSSISFQYKSFNTTGRNISYSVTGVEVPNEPNMDAPYKIAVFGDSTAWGANLGNDSQGRAYLGLSQWSEVFRDKCRANLIDAQIFANMAEDGKTMMEGWYNLLTGLNKVKYDLAFVSYGMNDAVSTKYPTEAKFKEACIAWITERNKYNYGKSLVFMAPNNTDDADRNGSSRMANIRTWMQSVATDTTIGGGVSNNVYFIDQSLIFPLGADATTDLNYKERVAGTRVHPSGLGSTLIGNYLWENLRKPIFLGANSFLP